MFECTAVYEMTVCSNQLTERVHLVLPQVPVTDVTVRMVRSQWAAATTSFLFVDIKQLWQLMYHLVVSEEK